MWSLRGFWRVPCSVPHRTGSIAVRSLSVEWSTPAGALHRLLLPRPIPDVPATECGAAPYAHGGWKLTPPDELADVLRMERNDRPKLGEKDESFIRQRVG